ncbi:MAG: TolC family protein [Burkholderiales bacterium]|nr:TolC family protein [Burkholderiales bacterium]
MHYLQAVLWSVVLGMPLTAPAAGPALSGQSLPAVHSATPLSKLLAEALQNNPEIQAARKDQAAASHRIAPAGALEDPMLEAGVYNVPSNSWQLDREAMTMKAIGVSQRIPYPGKRGLREEVAAREAQAVGHTYQEIANRIVRDLKLAYFDLGLVISSTRFVENNRMIIEQFLRIAETRYAVGQSNQADVLKAQTQLSKMMDELIKLSRERPMAEAEINRALGRSIDAAAPLPEPVTLSETKLQLQALHESALRTRPQLLALERTIARNEKALELARKEYFPDFDVRFSYGQRETAVDGTRRADLVNLSVAFNLPVWRDRKLAPRVAEAQAMRDQARMMYEAQRNELGAKLRQQVAAAEQSLRSARLYQNDILPQSRLTVEAALAAYKVGRVDFMTLLDSQMAVLNYEIAYAAAATSHNKALAEIDLVTGSSSF